MLDLDRSENLAQSTAEIGRRMIMLEACAFCGSRDLTSMPFVNDLEPMDEVGEALKDSDYHLCNACALLFARRRQSRETVADYYGWFSQLEHRDYAVYPPPESYRAAKRLVAAYHLERLEALSLIGAASTIGHIRCDFGSLHQAIAAKYPQATVYGWDYFDSNIRYAREQGIDNVGTLAPASIVLPQGQRYDLLLVNHIFTHALSPQDDLRILHDGLATGGVLYIYNEADHLLRFSPGTREFLWAPLNNFHKQLFSSQSLIYFLIRGGFEILTFGRRGHYMELAARSVDATGDVHAHALDEARRRAAAAVPEMAANFARWRRIQKSPLKGMRKVAGKVRRRLAG